MAFHVPVGRVWFLTWTCYGQWLPGDARGFVSNKFEGEKTEKRKNQVGSPYDSGRPALHTLAKGLMASPPVRLTREQAQAVREQMEETARIRGWNIEAGAVMQNHVHLLVRVPDDPPPEKLLRDFKSWTSKKLNTLFPAPNLRTWWTEGGSTRKIDSENSFQQCVTYILEQELPLTVWKKE